MAEHPMLGWLHSLRTRARAVARTPVKRRRLTQRLGQHMLAAVAWLQYAHSMAADGGMPAFYDLLRDTWAPSYPETSGYIVPTLLTYAERYSDEAMRRVGLEMAEYLLRVQTPEGAIRGWYAGAPAYIFDTGQVLSGWLAALQETADPSFRRALLRAADWLVAEQDPAGCWTRHQFGGHPKVWDARVAWLLLVVDTVLERSAYGKAGCRCLEWVMAQEIGDGWFRHFSLVPNQPPVTHTIAYTVEALLESGILLGDDRYVLAARRTADALLARQRSDGSLSAYWAEGWRPLSRSSCLTGDAQMALCWLRLYQCTGEARYVEASQQALAFVASTQNLNASWPPIRGAIAGSWPVWGYYLRWRYPNWAAKFFLDALMLQPIAPTQLDSAPGGLSS